MSDIDEKNTQHEWFLMDDSVYANWDPNIEKEYRKSLEETLYWLKYTKIKGWGYRADSDPAKFIDKMAEHGLRVKEDTDLDWLAYTLRRLELWTLEEDLEYLLFAKKFKYKLDATPYIAILASEIEKCGLELTPDTDIKQLAETVKQLGILEKIL